MTQPVEDQIQVIKDGDWDRVVITDADGWRHSVLISPASDNYADQLERAKVLLGYLKAVHAPPRLKTDG